MGGARALAMAMLGVAFLAAGCGDDDPAGPGSEAPDPPGASASP